MFKEEKVFKSNQVSEINSLSFEGLSTSSRWYYQARATKAFTKTEVIVCRQYCIISPLYRKGVSRHSTFNQTDEGRNCFNKTIGLRDAICEDVMTSGCTHSTLSTRDVTSSNNQIFSASNFYKTRQYSNAGKT
jgi:hypothetical protein